MNETQDLSIFLGLAIYFIPTIIAFIRGHASKWGIMLVNLILGFTGVGWLFALIWSVSNKGQGNVVVVSNNNLMK